MELVLLLFLLLHNYCYFYLLPIMEDKNLVLYQPTFHSNCKHTQTDLSITSVPGQVALLQVVFPVFFHLVSTMSSCDSRSYHVVPFYTSLLEGEKNIHESFIYHICKWKHTSLSLIFFVRTSYIFIYAIFQPHLHYYGK